jgi:hypothetical protein
MSAFFWCKILHKYENINMKKEYLIAYSMIFLKKRVTTFLKFLKILFQHFPIVLVWWHLEKC